MCFFILFNYFDFDLRSEYLRTHKMSSITDILNLNKLNMFQTLRKVLETNSTSNIRNLLAYKDQMLYVWNPDECCLYSLLLSTTQDDNPSYQVRDEY